MANKTTGSKALWWTVLAVPLAAVALAVFVLMLAALQYWAHVAMDAVGYKFVVSDEIAKTVITVGGALTVGGLALFGVRQQNLSAERRHRVDASLNLRKEIFLQVAEAASLQYQFLLSFASTDITEEDRRQMTEKIGAAFFRLQVVANEQTISAMLKANEAWARAMFSIRMLGPTPQRYEESMQRLIEIQNLAKPFMAALWHYNVTARKEIECKLDDDASYEAAMNAQYLRISHFLEKVRQGIVNSKPSSTQI
jgi:ABC-type multidrug transport system fused ATPase/permease subunit